MSERFSILLQYTDRLWDGARVTAELSLLGLVLALVIGLIICFAKISPRRWLSWPATLYTTVLRGVPDLVQLFLFFYGLQKMMLLLRKSDFGKAMGIHWQLDNFSTAAITIGLMFGAYMAETFRGAYLAVPKGQIEAAHAYGFSKLQTIWRITLPQMWRFALPGISNNWLVLMKTTALASLVQLDDLTKVVKEAATSNPVIKSDFVLRLWMFAIGAAGYLLFTTLSLIVIMWLRKHFAKGFSGAHV